MICHLIHTLLHFRREFNFVDKLSLNFDYAAPSKSPSPVPVQILNVNIDNMLKAGPGRKLDSGKKKPTMSVNASTQMPSSSGLGSATSTTTVASSSSDLDSPQQWIHPFAGSTAKLEIIPSSTTSNKIDVEEEARLYDELCRDYEEDSVSCYS